MNIRYSINLLMAAVLCGCATHKTAERHIAAHAGRIKAHEYQPARMIAEGDIDGDGIPDVAVIYSLEGAHHSNTHEQFLTVSSSRKKGRFFHIVAGGKDARSVDSVRVVAGRVDLALLEYNDSDASCCPSRQNRTSYIFKNETLVEIKTR